MLSLLISALPLVQAGCEAAPDCGTCLGGSVGSSCGWCAVNTTTATRVGAQCADIYSVFDCDVQFQTDKCVQGWKCGTTSNNQSQCVPSVGGVADKAECEKSCSKPPPPPPKPTPPAPPKPKTSYSCNTTTLTCALDHFGDPTQTECEAHCKTQYECDDASKTCMIAKPGSPSKKYQDNATCAQDCGSHKPVPYQLRGIWRGLAIQNKYSTGEWVANVSDDFIEIWYPDPSGYKLYLKGNTTSVAHQGMNILTVASSAGKLKGTVSILAGDFSFNPELQGFVQFAIDESNLAQNPTTFDDAMTQPSKTVISFGNCPAGGVSPPAPPPPKPPTPPGPPPPCKAEIDVVIVLDGSASIVSSDWQLALQFTNKIVAGFAGTAGTGIAKDAVQVAVVQFSESAQTVIGLSPDAAAITAAVTSLRQMKMNTNTYAGLNLAKQILDTTARAGDKDKLVILITDGQQNQGLPAKEVSDALHKENVQTFGIGVGVNIDEPELQSWCSLPLSKYYFKVNGFSGLEAILQKLVADACPHPPSSKIVAAARRLQAPSPPPPALGKNCKFHLPAGLPTSRRLEEAFKPLEKPKPVFGLGLELPQSFDPNGTDPCNAFPSCDKCIGAHAGGKACGWCSGSLKKGGAASPFQCAGRETIGAEWTCEGHYQTSTCDAKNDCGLDGTFRGLQIDNQYDFGEWSAVFDGQANSTNVKIEALDMSGKAKTTIEGKMTCPKKCSEGKSLSGTPFTLTTTGGDILHGICGYTDQAQAETTGLMFALSDSGVAKPPTDFDSAMLNTTQSSVYTYYRCASYKKGTCAFTAP